MSLLVLFAEEQHNYIQVTDKRQHSNTAGKELKVPWGVPLQ